ncbi:unnamed protein product [Boreogadus saida]
MLDVLLDTPKEGSACKVTTKSPWDLCSSLQYPVQGGRVVLTSPIPGRLQSTVRLEPAVQKTCGGRLRGPPVTGGPFRSSLEANNLMMCLGTRSVLCT